jgi:hypothetical protein
VTSRGSLPRAARAAPRGRPHARKPKAPVVPSHASRVARGPKPPDAVVAAFREALAADLADLGIATPRADGWREDAKKKSPVHLIGKTLKDLGALTDPKTFRPESLSGLRGSSEFATTGRVPAGVDRLANTEGIKLRVGAEGEGRDLFLIDGRHRLTVAQEAGRASVYGSVYDADGELIFRGEIPLKFTPSARLEKASKKAASGVARAARRGVVQALPRLAADIPAAVSAKRVAGFAETLLTAVVESITKAVESGNPGRALDSAAGVAQDLAQRESAGQTAELAQAAGSPGYFWTSELDRVVRPGHVALEGTIQLWSDPPDTGDGYRAHPGEPKNCRCVAVPYAPNE